MWLPQVTMLCSNTKSWSSDLQILEPHMPSGNLMLQLTTCNVKVYLLTI
jgi:hypothetical protein